MTLLSETVKEIDLEALRAALKLIDEAIREADRAMPTPLNRRGESTRHPEHHIAYMGELREARETVAAALAELTTRRARDAEVEALVAAAKRANGDHSAPHDCYATGPLTGDDHLDLVSCPGCELIAALKPFTGATP